MHNYYLNSKAQTNGFHEVHREDCVKLPEPGSRISLGTFDFCSDAIAVAQEKYQISKLNGCYYCAKGCHKRCI